MNRESGEIMLADQLLPFVRVALFGVLSARNHPESFVDLVTMDCRLFYFLEGEGVLHVGDRHFPFAPDGLVMIPSGYRYRWQTESTRYIAVNFDMTRERSHLRSSFHAVRADSIPLSEIPRSPVPEDAPVLGGPMYLPSAPEMKQMLFRLISDFHAVGPFRDAILGSEMKTVLLMLAGADRSAGTENAGRSGEVAERVTRFIQTHCAEDISNRTLAEEFHYSTAYLNSCMRRFTGVSLHEFLIECRISLAMEILRSQRLPVSEAAVMAGFHDVPHFTKTFLARVGQTPSAFRDAGSIEK